MARRIRDKEYSRVEFEGIDGLDGCSMVVWVNFPLRMLDELSERDPGSLRVFLGKIIQSWEGFGDLPATAEGIGELSLDEIGQMFPMVMRHITNPQTRNKPT